MRRALLGLGLSLLAACSSSGSMGEGLAFGRQCSVNEDCASGLCVSTGPATAVCSVTCSSDTNCPLAPNWGCVSPFDLSFRVCGCVATGAAEICGDGVDNDCDGAVDDCRVCNGVPVPANDPQHCGACNVACRADQTCAGGACVCADAFELECSGSCEDVRTSTVACGSCDVQCAAGQDCVDGGCVCSDPSSPDFCAGAGCVDFDTSAIHCGGCDIRCGVGQVCAGGTCTCPAGSPTTHCGASGCVDTETNADHCGECGQSCDITGSVCAGGDCGCPAAAPDTCNGACVDNESDRDHCGVCGNACPLAQACVDGTCSCPSATHTLCDGACVNPATNASHCGGCGQACDPGERCTSTGCVCDSQLYCGGVCVATSDAANCGACGNVCAVGQYCSGGSCTCNVGGLTACGDACVQVATDTQNCGGCGTVCRATEICNGTCMCPAGQTWCDEAGACVNLSNRADHCGACGNACPNGTTCQSGTCRCPAATEFYCESVDGCVNRSSNALHCGACDAACDNTEICAVGSCRCPTASDTFCANENRCVSTSLDEQNCGTCGTTCRNTESCLSGGCYCPSQHTFCQQANACVRLSNNAQHCGTCGNACAVDATCVSSACDCVVDGLTHCDGSCVDTLSDATNCGGCGTVCGDGMSCQGGACMCGDPTVSAPSALPDSYYHHRFARLGSVIGLAWSSDDQDKIYFRRFDIEGNPLSATLTFDAEVGGNAYGADLIANGTEFGLVFGLYHPVTGGGRLRLVRLDAAGTVLSDHTQSLGTIANVTVSTSELQLAYAPGAGYAVGADGSTRQAFAFLGPTGASAPVVTPTSGHHPVAVTGLPSGEFVMFADYLTEARVWRFDAAGAQIGAWARIGGRMYLRNAVAQHDGTSLNALVHYSFAARQYIRLFRGDRYQYSYTLSDIPEAMSGTSNSPRGAAGVGMFIEDGELLVVYAHYLGNAEETAALYLLRYELPPTPNLAPILLSGPTRITDSTYQAWVPRIVRQGSRFFGGFRDGSADPANDVYTFTGTLPDCSY